MKDLIEKVKEWSKERNIDKANPKDQMLKLMEEVGELANALARNDNNQIVDALGDIQVVLIILHQQLGKEVSGTLEAAYGVIKNRKGKTVNGIFVKEEDLNV